MSRPKPYYYEQKYERGAGTIKVHRWCKWLNPFRVVYVEQRISQYGTLWRIGVTAVGPSRKHVNSHKLAFDKALKTALIDVLEPHLITTLKTLFK